MSRISLDILLVGDEVTRLSKLSGALKQAWDYECNIAVKSRYDDGLAAIIDKSYDIIFCDESKKKALQIHSIKFIKNIRSTGSKTPIVLFSDVFDKALKDQAYQAGAMDYIAFEELTPGLLNRSMRYVIAHNSNENLLINVLDNTNAAISVVDENFKPKFWNSNWSTLAKHHSSDVKSLNEASQALARQAIANRSDSLKLADRVLDRHLSFLESDETVIMLYDVTEHAQALDGKQQSDQRITYLAMHDSLTGLPNRTAFEETLAKEIEWAKNTTSKFYLLNLDLNRFKEVNDAFGHKIGDGLLVEVSKRLKNCLRKHDFLARTGGDEFTAIQRHSAQMNDQMPELAKRFIDKVTQTFEIDGKLVRSGLSIGVAIFPDHGAEAELLLSNSDVAMYSAKQNKVNHICVFDSVMDKNIRRRAQLANDLQTSVSNKTIDIFFQPTAQMSTGQICGFEALARWEHPDYGPIPPSTFIPIAEENGLMIDLGQCILDKTCSIATTWPQKYKVAVNISDIQIRHTDLVRVVENVLANSGIGASRLELEIKESILLEDPDYCKHVLNGLKDLGVMLSMDNFGTGHSSLFSMLSFPFDKIKIDRSFVEKIDENAHGQDIVKAIMEMSKKLGFTVVAEGVEKQNHLEFLKKCGDYEMQGYLIGEPVSEIKTIELIMNDSLQAYSQNEPTNQHPFSEHIRNMLN